jgi:DNA-binding transcriptional MocR family regulator
MGANLLQNKRMNVPEQSITGRNAGEIAACIEGEILDGRFAPGAALPTVRALARALGVSPSTVAAAYKSLSGRGLLVAQGRLGTTVSPRPPIYRGTLVPQFAPGVRDLASGNPDPELLPKLGDALRRIDATPVLYGDDLLDPGLARRGLARFRADGIPAEDLCVVAGALDGLERVLAAHLRPGDRVAIEDPAFVGVRDLLAMLGLVAVPVAIDDSGPLPDALARALEGGVAALVVTPRAQNPTGACLDAERVAELAPILARHPDVLLCEDDHAGIVSGAPIATLVAADRERWAVVRSFSKSLGPDLRVALLAADAMTIGRVQGRQRLGMRWVSHLMQRLALHLWKDRSVQAGLRRAARTYTERRRALIEALAEHGIEAHGRSGLNVWIPVPEEAPVVAALAERGWGVSAGERFRLASPPAIRVSAAALPAADAPDLARALARALAPHRTSSAA